VFMPRRGPHIDGVNDLSTSSRRRPGPILPESSICLDGRSTLAFVTITFGGYGSPPARGRHRECCAIPLHIFSRFHFQTATQSPDTVSRSRGALSRPSFDHSIRPLRERARGTPDAQRIRSPVCKSEKHTSVVTTNTPKSSGVPHAVELAACFVLSPVIDRLFCHRRCD